ncbi:MAG: efflux RND transporter periplasmic adaptor subunit [Bacteroidetes bacterium]|nr:efflux RND transporter periplasmic adaptor subunit [Bacteroidota bacterium]
MKKTLLFILAGLLAGLGLGYLVFSGSMEIQPGKNESENTTPIENLHSADHDNQAGQIRIDPAVQQKMGVRTELAELRKLSPSVRANGVVAPDETAQIAVTARIMGYVEKLHMDFTGKPVRKGQALLELYSPDLVSAQEEYLQALTYEATLPAETQKLSDLAKSRLLNWGIPESELKTLETSKKVKRTLTLVSPSDGLISEKMVVEGQAVEAGMTLFRITNLSTVWVLADVYQNDLSLVKVGAPASIRLQGLSGSDFKGTVSFVNPELNSETRTVKIRIEVKNSSDQKLKPGLFASVSISRPGGTSVLSVSSQSLIHTGSATVAILSLDGGYFEPREVETGFISDGFTEILSGLHPGEKVVTSSQFLVDSESNLKSALLRMSSHQHETVSETAGENTPEKYGTKKVIYTCPMHHNIIRDQMGTCPICKMDLVRKEL